MNRKDLKPIHAELLRDLPGFVSDRRLLFYSPMHGMLRGLHFDPSAFSKDDFFVETLVLPLCVPTDHLTLLFGHRLRHPAVPRGWSRQTPDLVRRLNEVIQAEALPFLDRVKSAQDFADLARQFWRNPHAPKAAAFTLARAGDYAQAVAIIDDLLPTLNLHVGWEAGIFDICTKLKHLVLTDPAAADRQLAAWEEYTIGKLRLQRFR